MSEQAWKVWRADEDGCVRWWMVARSEDEARAELRKWDIPNEDTEEFTVEAVPDSQAFTLTCVDDEYEGELPADRKLEVLRGWTSEWRRPELEEEILSGRDANIAWAERIAAALNIGEAVPDSRRMEDGDA